MLGQEIGDPVSVGKELARAGRKQEAYKILRRALFSIGDDADVRFWLGAVSPTPAEAVEHLERCLELDPDNARARAGLQWANQQLAKSKEAANAAPPPAPEQYAAEQYAAEQYAPPPPGQFGFGGATPAMPTPSYDEPTSRISADQLPPDLRQTNYDPAPMVNSNWPNISFSPPAQESYDQAPATTWPPASPIAEPQQAEAVSWLPITQFAEPEPFNANDEQLQGAGEAWSDMSSFGFAMGPQQPDVAPMPQPEEPSFSFPALEPLPAWPPEEPVTFQPQVQQAAPSSAPSMMDLGNPWMDSTKLEAPEPEPVVAHSIEVPPSRPQLIGAELPRSKTGSGPLKRPGLEKISCPSCGTQVGVDDRFCQKCGYSLQGAANAVMETPPTAPEQEPLQPGKKGLGRLNRPATGAKVPFAPDKIRTGQKKKSRRPLLVGAVAAVLLLFLVGVSFIALSSRSSDGNLAAAVPPTTVDSTLGANATGVTSDTVGAVAAVQISPTPTAMTAEMIAAATGTAVADAEATSVAAAEATVQTEVNEFSREMGALMAQVGAQDSEFTAAFEVIENGIGEYDQVKTVLDNITKQNSDVKKELSLMKVPESQQRQYKIIVSAMEHRVTAVDNAGTYLDLLLQMAYAAQDAQDAQTKYQDAEAAYNASKAPADRTAYLLASNRYNDVIAQVKRLITYVDQAKKKYQQEWDTYNEMLPARETGGPKQ